MPERTRLVLGAVRDIGIFNHRVRLFQLGADTDAFCAAVRASRLERLDIFSVGPGREQAEAAAYFIRWPLRRQG